jgi:hypothetical protein
MGWSADISEKPFKSLEGRLHSVVRASCVGLAALFSVSSVAITSRNKHQLKTTVLSAKTLQLTMHDQHHHSSPNAAPVCTLRACGRDCLCDARLQYGGPLCVTKVLS